MVGLSILCLLLGACVPKIEKLQEEGDTEAIIKLLGYKRNAEVRMEAAVALGDMKEKDAIDPLLERLGDEDENVRAAAAVALGKIGDQSVISSLINQLKDESAVARDGAAQALVLFGVSAVDPLVGSLSNNAMDFRKELVHVLAEIGTPAIPSLIDALPNPLQNISGGAYDALVQMGEPAAEFLITHFTGITKGTQNTVKTILVEMGANSVPPLIDALDHRTPSIAALAGELLVEIGQPSIEPLIAALGDERVAWEVEEVLVKIGKPAVDPLIDALADPAIKEQAGDVLVFMREEAIDALISEYESNPESVEQILRPLSYGLRLGETTRENVHAILVAIGEDAVPVILEMAKASNMVVTGDQTLFAHEILYSPFGTVKGTLINGGICEDEIPSEGQIVLCERGENKFIEKVEAVQEGGGAGVIIYNNVEDPFNPTLGDDNEAQIAAVGVTLAEGEALLQNALGEEVLLVCEDTAQVPLTLAEIGNPAIPYLLDVIRNDTLIGVAEDTFIEMGSLAAPELLSALQEEDDPVKVELLYIMGQIDDERFKTPVVQALENKTADVRAAAALALSYMAFEDSIDPLIAVLDDEDEGVVSAAKYALVKIGLPAVEPLLAVYHDESGDQKDAAEAVLRDIFDDNASAIENMAADVCSGQSQSGASVYSRYESETHPTVVLDEDGDIHFWTNHLPVDWLPYTPEELELVVCLHDQEKQVVQVCQYVYTGGGGAAPSITRYRYEMEVALYAAFSGYKIGATTLRGSSPDYCPYTTSSYTTQITGGYVGGDEFATWLTVYGIPFDE
ncbi:MAG: HEAT repeat domain-containing protein [Anaerolineaceae bacterium]|nr:HEAT repeat domain-containing protein [Anaerolineaceae bacterium]